MAHGGQFVGHLAALQLTCRVGAGWEKWGERGRTVYQSRSTCEFRRAAGSSLLLLASRHALGNAAAASVRLPASPAPVCKTPGMPVNQVALSCRAVYDLGSGTHSNEDPLCSWATSGKSPSSPDPCIRPQRDRCLQHSSRAPVHHMSATKWDGENRRSVMCIDGGLVCHRCEGRFLTTFGGDHLIRNHLDTSQV